MIEQRLLRLQTSDLFDEGFDLYKRNFPLLVLIAASVVGPLDLAATWFVANDHEIASSTVALGSALSSSYSPGPLWDWIAGLSLKASLFWFCFVLILSAGNAALVRALTERQLGHEVDITAISRYIVRRLPFITVTCLLLLITVLFSWTLLVVPAIFTTTYFAVVLPAMTSENVTAFRAMKRSSSLIAGNGFRVFACQVLLGMLAVIIFSAIQLPLTYIFQTVLGSVPGVDRMFADLGPASALSHRNQAISFVCSGIWMLLFAPLYWSVVAVLFNDLRVRKEAYDIELLATELNYPPLSRCLPYLPPVTQSPHYTPWKQIPVRPDKRGAR